MKTIIRVEHLDGIGMFQHAPRVLDYINRKHSVKYILCELGWRHTNFPFPENDGIDLGLNDKEWYCAYKSIEQLQKWVQPREFEILFHNCYKILLLDVTEYQEGNNQVAYTKESITSSKDISNLFKINK